MELASDQMEDFIAVSNADRSYGHSINTQNEVLLESDETETVDPQLAGTLIVAIHDDASPELSKKDTCSREEQDTGPIDVKIAPPMNMSNPSVITELRLISRKIQSIIGQRQVSSSKIPFAPRWILDKALKSEPESNWSDAYGEVDSRSLRHNTNVISSNVVYKIKTENEDGLKMITWFFVQQLTSCRAISSSQGN